LCVKVYSWMGMTNQLNMSIKEFQVGWPPNGSMKPSLGLSGTAHSFFDAHLCVVYLLRSLNIK